MTGPKTTTVVSEDNKGRAEDKLTEKSTGLSASSDDVELSEESDKVSRSQVSLVLSKEYELERKESRPSIEGERPCLKPATESEPTVLNTHSSENILVLRSSKSGTHQSSVPTSYADQVRRDGPSTVVDASTADMGSPVWLEENAVVVQVAEFPYPLSKRADWRRLAFAELNECGARPFTRHG